MGRRIMEFPAVPFYYIHHVMFIAYVPMSSKVNGRAFFNPSRETSTWQPIFPPLKIIVPNPWADCAMTVGNCFFMPIGEHPPWTYPVRGSKSLDLTMLMLFSPTDFAAFFKSSSFWTGSKNT